MDKFKKQLSDAGFKNVINTLEKCDESTRYIFENFLDSHIDIPHYSKASIHKSKEFNIIDDLLSRNHANGKKIKSGVYMNMLKKACNNNCLYGSWIVLKKILDEIIEQTYDSE